MGCICPREKPKRKKKRKKKGKKKQELASIDMIEIEETDATSRKSEQIYIQTGKKISGDKNKNLSMDDFQKIGMLGKGSFGEVLLVKKLSDSSNFPLLYFNPQEKFFAMKVLKKSVIKKRNQQVHTKGERKILENVKSNFVVQLHYAFQTKTKLFLVLDFMRGGELFFHLKRTYKFSEKRAQFYIAEIILGMEVLHEKGIIYRDLKPENILMDEEGHLKLADFGLSKNGMYDESDKTNTFCGTAEYIAPEVLERDGYDKTIDWWSLVILFLIS